MIKLKRVCIVIGLACNFNCRYCYRDFNRKELPKELSENMQKFLSTLTSDCESVIISGGEPLLYWNKILEIFSYIPKNIHKKIMTNGSLLTEEIVKYANDNNIEIYVSHDGENTKYLRGIDIFENKEILKLVRKIRLLTIGTVVTNKSNDVVKCYNYITKKLKRGNFIYRYSNLMDTGYIKDLIDNFDYNLFFKSRLEFINNYSTITQYYKSYYVREKVDGFNVDLAGNIIGIPTLIKYGTISDDYEQCVKVKQLLEDKRCIDKKCPVYGKCKGITQAMSEHYCKCVLIGSNFK